MQQHSPAARVAKRRRAEARFKCYGMVAIGFSFLCLIVLLASIITQGYSGFMRTELHLTVALDPQDIDATTLDTANYRGLVLHALRARFPEVTERSQTKQLNAFLSDGAEGELRNMVTANPNLLGSTIGIWVPASGKLDMLNKKGDQAGLPPEQLTWYQSLKDKGEIRTSFNRGFFTGGDSRMAEEAGFFGALVGSLLTLVITMAAAFPLGVMTAVYLEEFAPRNRFIEILEVNINNLAAIPSIIYGLLGLSLYLNIMHMPRSASLVGGLTLAMLILPVVVISTRVAIGAVPPSIRDAALALGASPLQVVWQHVLPLSLPGIMTGTILGLARAIGETAPLLMIGMVAFVSDIPHSFTDPATVMPVQIYLWSSNPETAFVEKTAAGILLLLAVLVTLNALAIYIRKRFEVRW